MNVDNEIMSGRASMCGEAHLNSPWGLSCSKIPNLEMKVNRELREQDEVAFFDRGSLRYCLGTLVLA